MRRTAVLLGAVLVVGALAACSADAPAEPVTPDGWRRVESGALSFAVPESWVEVPQDDDLWSVGWADAPGDDATVLVVGAPGLGRDGAEAALDTFVAGAQVGGWGYGSTGLSTPVDTGALKVRRNDFTYDDDVAGVFWAAADPASGTTVGLQLTATELDEDVVQGLEASIAVRPDADE